MRLQNVEDADEIVVGKYYLVPTVAVNPDIPALRRVPVVGPAHEDAEFINFPHRHFHPDRRFVSDSWLNYYGGMGLMNGASAHWGVVYSFEVDGRNTGMFELGRKRLQCKRVVDPFHKNALWLMKLERAYAGEKLREGMVCPHRGISCRGVKVDDQGCVVCLGHGLQFDVSNGHLVSRIGQDLQMKLIR